MSTRRVPVRAYGLATAAVLAPAAAAVALLLLRLTGRITFGRADGLAVATLVIATGLCVVSIALTGRLDRRPDLVVGAGDGRRLHEAANLLAEAVTSQWHTEARLRGLLDESGRPLVAPLDWSVLRIPSRDDDGSVTPRQGTGYVDGMVAFHSRLPAGRLTILGPPGSGKSALVVLLALALLDRRDHGSPVPVLLSVASWDPTREDLGAWLERRLAEDYSLGRDTARHLVENGLVLPMLDGLDEIPAEARRWAITRVSRSPLRLPGLILTCRTAEYQDAEGGANWLRGSAVVGLEPVRPEAAVEFLATTAHPVSRDRWTPMFALLRNEPETALARALSWPLTLSLAQEVYADATADPGELVQVTDIETHLHRAFIASAFSPERDRSVRPWGGEAARRWLTYLAGHMELLGTRELAWWQLSRMARPATAVLAMLTAALIAGTAVGLGAGGLFTSKVGLVAGLLSGLVMGALCAWSTPPPSTVRISFTLRIRAVAASLVIAAAAGVLAGWQEGTAFGAAIGISLGFLLGVLFGLTGPGSDHRAISPRSLLRADVTVALFYGVVYGIATGIAGQAVGGLTYGIAFGVASGLAGGLLYGPAWALALQANRVGVIAWVHFALARIVLAPRGLLPWRTLAFLEDAHRLGVLRQVGGVYQFRHASLQDMLCADQRRAGRPL